MIKKIIIFFSSLLFLLIIVNKNAQGQLEYNGVKLISSTQTVPQAKVWKIESILCNQYEMVNTNISGAKILINNNSIYFFENSSPCLSSNNAFFKTMLPMWLPENTILSPSTGVTYISVIEFNVIP